ncbi:MAG: glycosyltransferase family 2 protein [Nonlabens sp.]
MVELSVVILNYNARHFLQLCLPSVIRALENIDSEIIIADNASTDGSIAMLAREFPSVNTLAFQENHGFSKGNNLAIAQSSGTYLCILNPDTIVGEQVFVEYLAFAKAYHSTRPLGFTGVRLIDGSGAYLPESKRHVPTPRVARAKLLGNDQGYYYTELEQTDRGEVEILVGAMMMVKKSAFDDCGGFDERYFMYGEDIDLSYTALERGYNNYYLGDLTVLHFKGESTVKDHDYYERFYGAMGLFYDKYFKRSSIEKLIINGGIKLIRVLKTNSKKEAVTVPPIKSLVVVTDDPHQWKQYETMTADSFYLQERIDKFIGWDLKSLNTEQILKYMSGHPRVNSYGFIPTDRAIVVVSSSSQLKGVVKEL